MRQFRTGARGGVFLLEILHKRAIWGKLLRLASSIVYGAWHVLRSSDRVRGRGRSPSP